MTSTHAGLWCIYLQTAFHHVTNLSLSFCWWLFWPSWLPSFFDKIHFFNPVYQLQAFFHLFETYPQICMLPMFPSLLLIDLVLNTNIFYILLTSSIPGKRQLYNNHNLYSIISKSFSFICREKISNASSYLFLPLSQCKNICLYVPYTRKYWGFLTLEDVIWKWNSELCQQA